MEERNTNAGFFAKLRLMEHSLRFRYQHPVRVRERILRTHVEEDLRGSQILYCDNGGIAV